MKLSRFNTAVPYDGAVVYHNSYSNRFLLLDQMLYDMIAIIRTPSDLEDLREIHEEFYNALTEYGFIVEEDTDEIAKARTLIESIDNQDSYFHLIVNPTMNCNFSCWYCYENHEKNQE